MKTAPIIISILLACSTSLCAQSLSPTMQKAVSACEGLSKAVANGSGSPLKAANKLLKEADLVNFGDLSLHKGKDIPLDGHFLFDEEFVDSLIVNDKVIDFSGRYAKKRSAHRGAGAKDVRVRLTTKALKAGQSATWKTVNRGDAEFALVAEPKGLFTMTIRDDKGKVLYAETKDNKKGAATRKAKLSLPADKMTLLFIEITNHAKNDASFAIMKSWK